jgi:hypothetical protein
VGVHTAYGDPPVAYDLDGPCMTDDQMSDTCGTSAACHCEADVLDPCETAFWLQFVDSDGDGQQDPYPAQLQADNGILDTWPRVFLEYIGAPTIDDEGNTTGFENEYGNNTFEWPVGTGRMLPERWVNENYPAAFSLMTLGISNIVPDTGNKFDPFPVKEMSVTFSPAFRHYHAGGAFDVDPPGPSGPWDLIDVRCFTTDGVYPDFATCTGDEIAFDVVPAGAWRLTMVTQVGQTWTLPNEIGVPGLAEDIGLGPMVSTSPDFDIGSQATYLLLE